MDLSNPYVWMVIMALFYLLDLFVTRSANPIDNVLLRVIKKLVWDKRTKIIGKKNG